MVAKACRAAEHEDISRFQEDRPDGVAAAPNNCLAGTAGAFGFASGFLGLAAGLAMAASGVLPGAASGVSSSVISMIAAAIRRTPTSPIPASAGAHLSPMSGSNATADLSRRSIA